MPRKQPHPRARRPPPPPVPAPAEDVSVKPAGDLADRRDLPAQTHANVGPDDRVLGEHDDIDTEGPERIEDVDAAVIEDVASHVATP